MTTSLHASEIRSGKRFEFGKNWKNFLKQLDSARIAQAEISLQSFLGIDRLNGISFLDIGSGSGLFSLAARRLGARVCSVDYDPQSVACTNRLRNEFFEDDSQWKVVEGSALDYDFLESLGKFDVVYSWGVLHHTGSMWAALKNAGNCVCPGGKLFISIYNDQGRTSKLWRAIKQFYNRSPRSMRFLILIPCVLKLWGPTILRDLFRGRPLATWVSYKKRRGMSPWEDVVDWVGGYPFEVASPEAIFNFFRASGFSLEHLKTCGGGLGCNEFLFRRQSE